MFVILTSKPDEYNALSDGGLSVVKNYDYYFYNRKKARFSIAKIESAQARVSIVEVGERGATNSIPIKFFESFDNLEAAEKELEHLTHSKIMDVDLRPVEKA